MMDGFAERRFGRFAIRPGKRELSIDGRPAKIGARAFDLLSALVERRQRVVSKEELLDIVWPGVIVEESNVQVQVVALRKLLGGGAISTIPGRGYKFSAPIEGLDTPLPTRTEPVEPASPDLQRAGPLFGRDADVFEIKALVRNHRLVGIVGPGGIGKTRVAQAVATDIRALGTRGVWIMELAPVEKGDLVAATVARTLGHETGSGREARGVLVEALRDQRALIVLDNCEQVIGAVADLAEAILDEAPRVHLLVTSQEPLKLSREQIYRLGPLVAPDTADFATAENNGAVELFAARARATDSRFVLTPENIGAVVEICRRLDGIPLAIEFAAARASLLGVEGLRRRLGESLNLLSGRERHAPLRHRTLRAALEWSYGLLTNSEQQALDRLGVFVGGFSLDAAQLLIADEGADGWAALDDLASLVDKSLVIVEAGDPPRYRLLETTRAFALERLAATSELERARGKHARALIAAFRKVELRQGPAARMAMAVPDLDNVRVALEWAMGPSGDRHLALELAGQTDFLWYGAGASREGAQIFRAIAPWVADETPPDVAARFWLSASLQYMIHEPRRQAEAASNAVSLYRTIGDRFGEFLALTTQAQHLIWADDIEGADRVLYEARTFLDPSWPAWMPARMHHMRATKCIRTGQWQQARGFLNQAVELNRRAGGDAFGLENAEHLLLVCDSTDGHFLEVVRKGRELLSRTGSPLRGSTRAVVTSAMGGALAELGDLEASTEALRLAIPMYKRAYGSGKGPMNHVAFLLARQGRFEAAARIIGRRDALQAYDRSNNYPGLLRSYDAAVALVEAALDPEDFARLREEGARLSDEEAAALAFP
jgi:predicted ATPase/DNA-binding winged helix-turn-helix (wHTH) protein